MAANSTPVTRPDTQQQSQAATPASEKALDPGRAHEKGIEINVSTLSQAWMAFALRLPENEKALADRMKIITPSFDGNASFTINVDNQLAAELFEKESRRICNGMSEFLNGITPAMKIHVNEVVVERHVSDRTKQYEILKEKNPLLEKMRVNLNLELTR